MKKKIVAILCAAAVLCTMPGIGRAPIAHAASEKVDKVQSEKADTEPNMVLNGGFETAVTNASTPPSNVWQGEKMAEGWECYSDNAGYAELDTTEGNFIEGGQAAKVTYTNQLWFCYVTPGTPEQGEKYKVRFWLKNTGALQSTFQFLDNSGTAIKPWITENLAANTEGKYYEFTYTVPANAKNIKWQVFPAKNAKGTFWLDDVKITKYVKEPLPEEDITELNSIVNNCYEQATGFSRGGHLDTSNSDVKNYIKALDKEAAGYWNTMIKSDNADREQLWPGIKPNITAGVGANTESADLTTTFKYLFKLTLAYETPGSSLHGKQEVAEEVLKGIDFTLENNWYGDCIGKAYYGNWWDHRIGVPAQLLPAMVILKDQISEERMKAYLGALRKQNAHSWSGQTAANVADICLNAIYIASIENDKELMTNIKNALGNSMFSYTTGNGWHADGSYVDHGKFAYTGGYGSVFINAMSKMYPLLSGTQYELKFGNEKDQFYDEVVFKSYLPLHYAGRIFDVVSGRSITRVVAQNRESAGQLAMLADMLSEEKSTLLKGIVKKWLKQDPGIMSRFTEPCQLSACLKILNDTKIKPTEIPKGYYKYNDMDKAVQQTDKYAAVVSMHSKKIANYEWGNAEGMKMWNISDGALFINNSDIDLYRDNYFPTVDSLRFPGVTTLYDTKRSANAENGTYNPNDWVSSMGMGNIGVSGMQIDTLGTGGGRDGLRAKKSYFMFDNEIVAVGSGITALSSAGLPAETVIENRKIKEDLSNPLLINGKEKDIIDNSDGEIVTDGYLKVSTSAAPGAGFPHSFNRSVSEDTKKLTTKIRMRYADSGINAGIRFYGKNAEGKSKIVFELVLRQNGAVHCWDTYDGKSGKDLFTISNINDWFTLETTMYPETSKMSYKITKDDGTVLAEDTDWAFMDEVESLTSAAYYMNDKMKNRIDTTSFRMEEDGVVTEELDFKNTSAEEVKAMEGWKMVCTDLSGEIKEAPCTHDQFTVVSEQTKEKARKGKKITGVTWAHLKGNVSGSDMGYYFPGSTDVLALKEKRTGAWKDINTLKNWGHDDLPAYTRGYASMVIDHGVLEQGGEKADYEYVLLPGMDSKSTSAYSSNPDVEIIQNSEDIHAVREKKLNVTALNSWSENGGSAGGITVNRYASVLWKETKDTYELVVSDPTHKGGTNPIELTIDNAMVDSILSKDDQIQVISQKTADSLKLSVNINGTRRDQQYTASFKKVVNKTELKKLIDEFEKYSLNLDKYTPATAKAFITAFNKARNVFADGNAAQADVDAAHKSLQQAAAGLKEIPNKSNMEELMGNTDKIDFQQYTAASAQKLRKALEFARKVFADENATKEEVEQAEKMLRDAMNNLKADQSDDGKKDENKNDADNSGKDTNKNDGEQKNKGQNSGGIGEGQNNSAEEIGLDKNGRSAETGDTANIILWLTLMLAAGAGMFGARRKQYR